MKKIILPALVMAPLAASLFTACNDSDEVLTPNETFVDKFAVPADATGPEAELRRGFYDRTGCHLIFNDTLSTVTDENGNLRVEVVDFEWSLTTSGTNYNTWELFDDIDEQRLAASVIEEHILPHLQGGPLSPHSVMPFKSIYDDYDEEVLYMNNWRCLGLNLESILDADDADRPIAALELIKEIFLDKVTYRDERLEAFHEICDEYTGGYISDYFPEWEDGRDMDLLYSLGFIDFKSSRKPVNDKFLSRKNDYTSFVNLVFESTPEEVMSEYGQYEKIMLKYEIVKNLVEEIGIKL